LDEVGASCKPKGPQDAAQCANEILWRFKTAANHSLDEINFFASLLRANRDYFPAWLVDFMRTTKLSKKTPLTQTRHGYEHSWKLWFSSTDLV
jgi:hypothetical protein